MKRTASIVLLALLASLSTFSQVNEMWDSRYTGAGSNIDACTDMVIDASGNSYLVGTSWNGASGFDIVTVMYNTSGIQQWVATFDGAGSGLDEGRAIGIDGSGNVYVAGMTMNLASNFNIVTIKYDNGGNQQWAMELDGPAGGYDGAYDIAVDALGNSYTTGEADGGALPLSDYATVMYNTAGVQQYASYYDGTAGSVDAATTITIDAAGNAYVSGRSSGAGSNIDYATVMYNNLGAQQWASVYNGAGNLIDEATAIALDATNNVFVTGYSYGGNGPDYDMVTVKYNNGGAFQWDGVYNGAGSEYDVGNAIAVEQSTGMVYVCGRTKGVGTSFDYILAKYDNNGTLQWDSTYNGPPGNGYDEANALVLDGSGNIFVAGTSAGIGTNNDYRTIKYDSNGNLIWEIAYDGPANNAEKGNAIAVNGLNQIYTAGKSRGIGTNEDYAIVKYCQFLADAGLDTFICIGDTVTMTGANGTQWQWGPSATVSDPNIQNPLAYPTATTVYQVTITDVNGCTDVDVVTVTVNPLPGPNITASGPTSFCIGDSVTLSSNPASTYNWNTGDTTQNIIVTTQGNYSLTVIDSMGCANATNMSVTVWALPTVSADSTTAYCEGDSTQLWASGASTYAWIADPTLSDTSIANPWAYPGVGNTTYTVWGTDTNGCVNTDMVTITVWANPAAPTITNLGDTLLVSSATSGNQWFHNGIPLGGETGQTHSPTINGDYTIMITDTNGCSAWATDTIAICCIGIEEWSDLSDLNIFPNPNNGLFTIAAQFGTSTDLRIEVLDLTGRRVISRQLAAVSVINETLDISAEAQGVYFVRLSSAKGQAIRKLVVN